jgi:hypothetical protein
MFEINNFFIPKYVWKKLGLETTFDNEISMVVISEKIFSDDPSEKVFSFPVSGMSTCPGGFILPGVVVCGAGSNLRAFMERYSLSVSRKVMVGKEEYATLLPHSEIAKPVEEHLEVDSFFEKFPDVAREISEILLHLGSESGYSFVFHGVKNEIVQPYPENDLGKLHVVIGTSPPCGNPQRTSILCGVRIRTGFDEVNRPGPAPARGVGVHDDNKRMVAQIIGSTIYMMLPTDDQDHFLLMSKKSEADLFRKAFVYPWNVIMKGEEKEDELKIATTFDEYRATIAAGHEKLMKDAEEMTKKYEEEIRDLQKELRKKYRDLSNMNFFVRSYRRNPSIDLSNIGALQKDWDMLNRDPIFSTIHSDRGFCEMKTKPVFITERGVRYPMNTYTIHLIFPDQIYIWADNPTHPKRMVHPHISSDGVICFGNASMAIDRALSEIKIGRTAVLVLRWLEDGYDKKLAVTKIEEWPKEVL